MLTNQWFPVLQAKALQRRALGLRRFGTDLVFWRDGEGNAVCARDACPHRGAALSRGRVQDGCIACPYHGIRFDGRGQQSAIPFTLPPPDRKPLRLRTYPVREARGLLWVFRGEAAEALPPIPWDDAFEAELRGGGGGFVEMSDTFDVSYLRVMENLSDYHHVAHVHRRTAPVQPFVSEYEARREGVHIYVRGVLGEKGERGHLVATTHTVAPFIANLCFEGLARFAVAACPIDEHAMWLFARYTQTFVRVPGLRKLASWLLGWFDYRLLQRLEDAPVWRSQALDAPDDIRRYHLFGPDEGVRLYFDVHRSLQL